VSDINELNILVAIKKLKNNCTCGPDGLPPTLFKRLQYIIAKPLSIIYNQLFSVAFVPDVWNVAVITPVHKEDPPRTALITDLFLLLVLLLSC